jgi:hypothetical protein
VNNIKKNQESLNAQGIIDYVQWMIDRRGNPPRIDHLPLRHQVLASRVTIRTMRFVAGLKIANLVKYISGKHQIFGCRLCPATEAAETIAKKRRVEGYSMPDRERRLRASIADLDARIAARS